MEPFVNPWVFYWIDIIDSIKRVTGVMLFLFVVVVAILFFVYKIDEDYKEEIKLNRIRKNIKYCIIGVIIFAILTIAIPGNKVLYQMLLADQVTVDTVNKFGNIVDYVDYIIKRSVDMTK